MTTQELDIALRAFNRRRPFRPYFIELVSGDQILTPHPETVTRTGTLYGFSPGPYRAHVFAASSVCQLLDPPE